MPPPAPTHVWYTSYGSNCSRARFLVYLDGGRAQGADDVHHGARDATPPLADGPAFLATNVCFTGHSSRWNGAPAFLEHRAHPVGALGRRYLVTLDQFADVLAQENRRRAGDIVLPGGLAELAPGDRHIAVDGAYGAVVALGDIDGHPAYTFTSPMPPENRDPAPPSAIYLATILHGLREVHTLDDEALVKRVHAAAGVHPYWRPDQLHDLLRTPLGELSGK